MKTIQLTCNECGESFTRRLTEHNHNLKDGRTNTFCNQSCQAIYNNKNRPVDFWKTQKLYDIKKHSNNRLNDLSPFQPFLSKGKDTIKRHVVEIDAIYLKEIWEKQSGICPYTGIKMILPKSSSSNHRIRSLKAASLDRIDSSKEYVKGNVEFVCYAINMAKNNHTKKEMKSFLREIDLGITQP